MTAERSCPLSLGAENASEQKPGGFTRNVSLSHSTYMTRLSLVFIELLHPNLGSTLPQNRPNVTNPRHMVCIVWQCGL